MTQEEIKSRLAYLKSLIIDERISYGEIAELESLAKYIDPNDTQLLEWAGVPEFTDDTRVDIFNNVKIYDNHNKTVDRYSVFIKDGKGWAVFTMSENPLSPWGINLYSHNVKNIKSALSKDDKEIQEIPFDVREAIKLRINI